MVSFIIVFFISNILLGIGVIAVLRKIPEFRDTTSLSEQFVAGIGITPALISLFLYYLLLFMPIQKDIFYVGAILMFFGFAFFIARVEFLKIYHQLKSKFQQKPILMLAMLAVTLLIFSLLLFYVSKRYITEHDTIEYALLGKIFYRDKIITYSQFRHDPITNFYYVGLHGFSFPLLLTWENIFNFRNTIWTDLYYRSVSGYYGLLNLILLFLTVRRFNHKLALTSLALMLLNYGFFVILLRFHLDTYRLFFVSLSTLLFLRYFYTNHFSIFILGCMVSGFHAFIHSLGVFFFFIWLGTFFLIQNKIFFLKIKDSAIGFVCFLIFGGIHYVIDIFKGTGWVFKDIKWF